MTEIDTSRDAVEPNFEGFAKAILEGWPVNGIGGSELFDMSVSYGMIAEILGGYDPEQHIDAEGTCPEAGDPWYEYTFRGGAGHGLFSIQELRARAEKAEAERDEAWNAAIKAAADEAAIGSAVAASRIRVLKKGE